MIHARRLFLKGVGLDGLLMNKVPPLTLPPTPAVAFHLPAKKKIINKKHRFLEDSGLNHIVVALFN